MGLSEENEQADGAGHGKSVGFGPGVAAKYGDCPQRSADDDRVGDARKRGDERASRFRWTLLTAVGSIPAWFAPFQLFSDRSCVDVVVIRAMAAGRCAPVT